MTLKKIVINIALLTALATPIYKNETKTLDDYAPLEKIVLDTSIPTDRLILPVSHDDQLTTDSVITLNNEVYQELRNSDNVYGIADEYAMTIDRMTGLQQGFKESSFRTNVKSPMGARGYGQQFKAAWESVGLGDMFNEHWSDARWSKKVMYMYDVWILKFLEAHVPGWDHMSVDKKRALMLAGYNAGVGSLQDAGYDISKLSSEARNYVKNIQFPVLVDEQDYELASADSTYRLNILRNIDKKINAPIYLVDSTSGFSTNDIELGKISVNYKY